MRYDSRIRDDAIDDLFKGILLLENVEECYRFFDDLYVSELKALTEVPSCEDAKKRKHL